MRRTTGKKIDKKKAASANTMGRLETQMLHWSLRSLLTKLIKIGTKVVFHSRTVTFQMAEVAVSEEIWAELSCRIDRLRWVIA